MLGVNVGAVALLSDRERADRMASEEQHGRLISVSKDEIKVNVDAQLPPSRPKQLAAFKCGRSHFNTFLKNERAQGRHDLPSEYDSMRCRELMFEKGRALFERYFAYCAEQHGKYKPGTLKNYISQLHVDLVYRTQDVAQLCPCLHGDWSKRVDTVVKAITVARHHAGLSVASHAAAFTEEDWILMSTALADDDTPRSQTLLAALNFAVLLMGRTSDVGGAKQTKTSVRMARGLMQFGLMRVKGRQAQCIGIAEAMDNPMRSALNAWAHHLRTVGALASSGVEEPFLFRGAGSDPKALFKEVISRAVAVLAANGRSHLLSPGITAHSLRNCAFNIALEHPDVPPAAVSMHGGWADATWSRSNAGTGPEVVYHVFKQTQNDMVARAIRRCADLRFGGLHPTLPPFDPAWSDDQPLRMAYAFAEVWFVENADYIDPSLVRAASASVLMWFSYWEERLGSDCLRCRQVLDTASLAGFGRETVIRIGNQIRETWMASQVGAVETTLADPDRPSCASTVPASLSHRLERLEAQQREILRGLAAIRAAQDQRHEGSASATTACTLPSGPVALSSETTAGTLPSGREALSWTSTFPEELLSLAKVPARKIFFAAHTTGLMTAADVPEEQRKRAGRVRSKCSTLLMPVMNHFAPKPVAPRPSQDASAHDVVQWRLKLTRIALASETKAKAWIEESSGRQVHSAGAMIAWLERNRDNRPWLMTTSSATKRQKLGH